MKSSKKKNKPVVYVGLSGGVDSAVSAALLQKQGYEVVGVFMRQYDTQLVGRSAHEVQCTWLDDRRDAIRVAATLDIPFREWDFRADYHDAVVDYLFREYQAGRTPNPDVMCNTFVKFGAFLKRAVAEGADFVATGHYVKLGSSHASLGRSSSRRDNSLGPRFARDLRSHLGRSSAETLQKHSYFLSPAVDVEKDQSYFLHGLTQEQLSHCLFPLGEYKKSQVRAMARKFKLSNAEKKDSQGICFVGMIPMKDFLQTKLPKKRGKILTLAGELVGEHEGAALYTIGQRHGVGLTGGGEPYFVIEKDVKKNIVYVAAGEDNPALFKKHLDCAEVNWIASDPLGDGKALTCLARIRYRQPLQRCAVRHILDSKSKTLQYHVEFTKPQRAVTPGQSIVFYKGDVMLGGGVIL